MCSDYKSSIRTTTTWHLSHEYHVPWRCWVHKEHKNGGGADVESTWTGGILRDSEASGSLKLIVITWSRSSWKLYNMAFISAFPCETEQQKSVGCEDGWCCGWTYALLRSDDSAIRVSTSMGICDDTAWFNGGTAGLEDTDKDRPKPAMLEDVGLYASAGTSFD